MLYIILLAMLQRLFRWPQVLMWKIFVSILMSFIGLTRAKNIKAFLGNFVISVTVTHEIVRYVSVRWLSLEKAVYRILKLYRSLQSYFRSESEPQARFTRLCTAFDDPMTEVYLLLYKSVLPTFTHVNLLLQREDPNIYLVADAIRAFLRKLLSKFVTFQAIRNGEDITEVDFENRENQLDDSKMTIGLTTKQCLSQFYLRFDWHHLVSLLEWWCFRSSHDTLLHNSHMQIYTGWICFLLQHVSQHLVHRRWLSECVFVRKNGLVSSNNFFPIHHATTPLDCQCKMKVG